MNIGVARGEIQIETGQAISSLNQFGSALQQASQMGMGAMQAQGIQIQQQGLAYQQLGRVAIGAGAAMAAPFVGAFKAALNFESQMAGVNAVMDLQGDQFQNLSDLASQLGQDTVFTGEEAARAIETLGKAGLSYEQIMGGAAKASTDLAAAAETDVATAADAIAAGIQSFGLSGEEANTVADAIAGAANSSLASMEDIARGFGNVGSTASLAGMDVYDTAAALAVLTDRGQSGTDAATTLRTALQHLLAPTDKAQNLMNDLGLEVVDATGQFIGLEPFARQLVQTFDELGIAEADQIEIMKKLAGQDGMRALVGMVDAVRKEYSDAEKGIDDYNAAVREQGAAERFARERMDSTAGAIERLMGSISVLGERVGAPMLTAIRPVVEILDRIVDAIANLPGPVLAAAGALGSLTAAFTLLGGAGLFAAGHLVEAIGRLTSVGVDVAAVATRIRSLIPVILAVTAALAALGVAWENDFLGMRTTVENFFGGIRDAFNEGVEIAGKLNMDGVAAQIYGVSEAIRSLGAEEFAQKLRIISGAIQDFFDIRDELQDEIKEETPTWTSPQESDPILGDPKMGEDTLNLLENITTNLEAAARSADKWIGKGNGLSKTLRTINRGAEKFAETWAEWQKEGNSGIESFLAGAQAVANEIGWTGLAENIGRVNTVVGEFRHGVEEAIANGANPFAAVIGQLGSSIESLTGLPVGAWARDMGSAVQEAADRYQTLLDEGVDPLPARISAIGTAIEGITGIEGLADQFDRVALAVEDFMNLFDQAIDNGLNPFHAAAIGLAGAIRTLFGEDNPIAQWIVDTTQSLQDGAERIQQFGDDFTQVFSDMVNDGVDPLTSAITALTAAWMGSRIFEMPEQIQGILTFIQTLGALKDALLAGDWAAAGENVRSAIDQVVGAIGTIDLGTITGTISDWIIQGGENLWDRVKEWALGGPASSESGGDLRGPRGRTPSSGGAVVELGDLVANVGKWIIEQTQGARDLAAEALDWAGKQKDAAVSALTEWGSEAVDKVTVWIGNWDIQSKAGDLVSAVKRWALGGVSQPGGQGGGTLPQESPGAIEIAVGAVTAMVSGWLVRAAEGIGSLVEKVREWALGQSPNSMGGPGERGEAGTGQGAIEIAIGSIKAIVSGWLVDLASGVNSLVEEVKQWAMGTSPNSMGGPGERGEAGTETGAIEIAIGSIKAVVAGWIVELAASARSLAEELDLWANGSGSSQSLLGPGGELTGPNGRGSSGTGALVEIQKVTAEVLGWLIEGGSTLYSDIVTHLKDNLVPNLDNAPIEEVTANIKKFLVDSSDDISARITEFVQGLVGGSGQATNSREQIHGGGGGVPIGDVLVSIKNFTWRLAGSASDVAQSLVKFVVDTLKGINFTDQQVEGAEQLGYNLASWIIDQLSTSLSSAETKEAAFEAGKNASGIGDIVDAFIRGMVWRLTEAIVEVSMGEEMLNEGLRYELYQETKKSIADMVREEGVFAIQDGFEEGFGDIEDLRVPIPGTTLEPENAVYDLTNSGVSAQMPPEGVAVGIPVRVTPDGYMLNALTGQDIEITEELERNFQLAKYAGVITVQPDGMVVDIAGRPVLFDERGMPTSMTVGEPIYLTPDSPDGIYVDAQGREFQATPELQAQWDKMWQNGELFAEDGQLMLNLPGVGRIPLLIPNAAFEPAPEVGEAANQAVGGAVQEGVDRPLDIGTPRNIGKEVDDIASEGIDGSPMPRTIEKTALQARQAIVDGITKVPDTGTGSAQTTGGAGIGNMLDALLAGEVTEAQFIQATAAIGTKMAEAITQAFSTFSTSTYGGSGQMQAGGIGESIMTNLTVSIQGANTEALGTALKNKIGEAISQGMSASGGQAGQAAGAAAGGIGTSLVSSLASAIGSADFAAVGSAISTKISAALATGMTTAGGQAGGAGAAGGAGGGIGASVAKSLVSAIDSADFSAIGQTISTKLGEALQNVKGEGLGAALQGVFDKLAADAASMASSLQPVGAALIEGIAAGTGSAAGVLQSAVAAVISATVSSASGVASSSTPPVGTAFVTGAASGVGPATGTFQSAVDAMIQAAVASGSATATSSAVAVGAGFATGSGTGIGQNTSILQDAVGAMIDAAVASGVGVAESLAPAIGAAIAAGAAAGVRANAAQVATEAAAMVTAAIDAANAAAGISSPSKVFMEMGGYMSEGAALGIKEKAGRVADEARNMVQRAIRETEGLRDINKEVGGNVRGVNAELKSIEEIAGILENAPGWNDFGQILRSSSAGIKDSVGAIREDVKDLVRSVKEQLKDMVHQFREAGKQSGSAIGEGIASGAGGAGSGIGGSIEKTLNSELANINLDQLVIGRDMFKTAKQGIGELKGVGGELNNILQIAEILENAPGWNDFGAMLRESAGNIQGDVGGARDKFRDIMKEMNQISRDQAKAMKEIMKELAATIGDLASKVGESAGSGMSSGMSKGQESAETAGSDMAYGSVGAIESTIENLKGNLSNVGMGAGQALGGGMQKTASEMTEIGNEVGTALGDGATQGLQDSVEGGSEIAETAGDSLGSSFNSGVAGTIPDAMQLGSQISNSVLEALRASAIGDTEAVRMIGDAFGRAFGQGISSATPEAVQAGKNLTDATETGMIAGSPSAEGTATDVGKDIGSSLGSGIEDACKPVNNAARDITSECAAGGIESVEGNAVKTAERTGENIGEAVGDGISDAGRDVEREGKNLGMDAVTSVRDAIDSNATKMKASVTSMVNKAKVDPSADAKPVGTNFVQGMIDGLTNKEGALYTKVIQIVNDAIAKANTTAQNASPSKRMIEWGQNVGDGMVVGLASKGDPLVDTMVSMVESVVDAAQIGEVSVGTFTMDAVGQNMKWAASQVNSLLDRGTSERMRALEAYTSNKSGKQSASKASSSPTIQVGDIILKEGDPLYDQAKSFFGSVAAQHIPYYGSSRRS